MALKKSKTDDKGHVAEYHRIVKYHYDVDKITQVRNEDGSISEVQGDTMIVVALYKDSTARLANKAAYPPKDYHFPNPENEPSDREDCYILLKTHSDFNGSEDC